MSQNQVKTGSLLEALLELQINDKNDADVNNEISTIHDEITKADKLKLTTLPSYNVPQHLLTTENERNNVTSFNTNEFRRNEHKYAEAYTKMLHLEEAAESNFLSGFNQTNMKLWYSGSGRQFTIKNNYCTTEMIEAIDEGVLEQFILKPTKKSINNVICGSIIGKNDHSVFVEIFEDSIDCVHSRELYDICFQTNRLPFQLQHNALKILLDQKLFNCLIENPKYDDDTDRSHAGNDIHSFRGKSSQRLNEQQKIAVKNIIEMNNFPLPYLVFGPAGTGKSSTLVAAIEEIVRTKNKCVLVCATSNAACDEITERLVSVLFAGEIMRLYAKSFNPEKISNAIKPICNWRNGEFHFPSLSFLYQFRVLICTSSTAGYLSRASEDPDFRTDHFGYVFIDECASAHETTCLIPIAGVCTSYNRVDASIILAGDPKQLDAVTKSSNAVRMGFKTSFMEHLFLRRIYQRDPFSGEYNHKYINQLVENYRSHSTILHVPNALFYENKLISKAPPEITDWYIDSKWLPSKKFPIIFRSVQGRCTKSKNDSSRANIEEVNVVIDYLRRLLLNVNNKEKIVTQSDIGVITPYKLQCKEIRRACERNGFGDVTVGSVEIFQGQERPVIIVSTVRTNSKLGFVIDPRRLNVIITRAKCLLIIIGDPHTLCLESNWKELINYCIENNALIQGEKHFQLR